MTNRESAPQALRFYVQYGSGLCAPTGWINFDSSPRLRLERLPGLGAAAALMGKRLFPPNVAYGDIIAGLPLRDGTADAIYASHVLEHLPRGDIGRALTNTWRLLKPGGVFRMIVPDLEWRARRYVNAHSAGDSAAADSFIKACNIGEIERARGPMALLRAVFGNSGHRWMYDKLIMYRLLADAGFVAIRRCEIGDSGDAMFDKVEDRGRFHDQGESELAFHARKP